jgi:hypothetical protein
MAKPAITAIVFGAMLFVLGMVPGVLAGLMDGLQNLRNHLSPTRGPIRRLQTHHRLSGDICLLVGGGVMMIAGFLALLFN